ncbi:MAG: amidohydrolase [Thermoplasmata archaeon]|nr:amidohydrolase [Thermoplasmatales archaeon]
MRISFRNCKVYSKFMPLEVHDALVVEDGRVISFNEEENARDLGGSYIIPAFVDSHLHLDEIGLYLNSLDLRGVKSIKELRYKLEEFASRTEGPIIGHGWDQELFMEGRWPSKVDIDDIVNDRPVFLSRVCLHAALVNSYFLELMGMEGDGIVKENEFEIFRKRIISMVPREKKIKYMRDAVEHVASYGICKVGYVSCSLENLSILEDLRRKDQLPIDVLVYLNSEDLRNYDGKSSMVKGIKLFVDGSLGARTALLSKEYSDQGTRGEQVMDYNKIVEYIEKANECGLDVAIHAIGDAAVDIALEALKHARNGKRIEHASVVRDDQLEKFEGIDAVVQPHFIISDFWVLERLGVERARYVYRFRDLMNETNVAFSTDAPVEPVDPFLTLDAAINRGKNEFIDLYRYTEDQSLRPNEAYHCYTSGSMRALGLDCNPLQPGDEANFLILDRDPLSSNQREIKILEIYFRGKRYFKDNKR